MGQTVLITGAATGIGRDLALLLRETGHRPVASMRGTEGRNDAAATAFRDLGIPVVEIDVLDDASVQDGLNAAFRAVGSLDVLVNNAAFAVMGPVEASTPDDLRMQFETNVIGPHRVLRAVLPHMRERGSGLIVNVSSGAGRLAFPGQNPYNASKWAVEALSEGLRFELAPLGLDCVLVEPGPYATSIDASMKHASDADRLAAYPHIAEHAKYRSERTTPRNPKEVADAIVKLIEMPRGTRPTRTVVHPYLQDVLDTLNAAHARASDAMLDLYGPGKLRDNGV